MKGKLINKHGKLQLSNVESAVIVKMLLPRVDPKNKLSEYKTMGLCIEWLMKLAGDTTWETEMQALEKEYCAAIVATQPILF